MREADLRVDETGFAAMGIHDLVALSRAAGLRDLAELACHGTGGVVRATVEERYDEAALSDLASVDRWEHVAETDDGHVYVIAFTAPDLPADLADEAADLVGTCDPEVDERGATVSLTGPQEAIAAAVAGYEAAGASPDLRRLGEYEGGERPLDALTDRQEAVLRTAYDLGYYEVPREVDTAAVAAELDLDPSTVTEHLQRAERNLLARLL